jgi:uncharacterized cofD-like protein
MMMLMQPGSRHWFIHGWQRLRQEVRWLTPGLGVKRWFLLILAGITLLGVGLAVLTLEVYRTAPETWWLPVLSTLSLRDLDRPLRVLIFGAIGIGMILVGAWGMNRALLRPFATPGKALIDTVSAYRRRDRGPRVVAIGGGHGLAALLRGLKDYTHNLTAIVTVADDGGSSGELRRSIGILPPGDIRNCLAALSNDEALLTQVFQYRFAAGAGLEGHSLGNLFITALTDITGSFEEAVAESARVLAVHGQVLPATLRDVCLVADVQMANSARQIRVSGESKIPEASGKVRRVWLEPNNPPAFPPAVAAILSADVITIGPGSLYTSILPNLLVPDLADAVRASRGLKIYVCNVATQPGETDGYSCLDHVRTIENHVGGRLFDLIICNRRFEGTLPEGSEWVKTEASMDEEYAIYRSDLVDVGNPWRHDSTRLAQVVMDLFYERTGPLSA